MSVFSLVVSSRYEKEIVDIILSLFPASNRLSTLVVLGVSPSGLALRWPDNFLKVLARLELYHLSELTSPTLDQIITMLSISPLLHMIRLHHHLLVPIMHIHTISPIDLPNLRLLDITVLG
jgi:hypothetical protein